MKRYLAAVAAATTFGVSACDRAATAEKTEDPPAATAPDGDASPTPASTPPAAAPEAPPAPRPAGGADTPVFAVLYPGAAVEGAPLLSDGPAGPGGLVAFTTPASPDEVVAFYRGRAENAGLNTIMSMSQGEARAYGAAGEGAHGASVRVVASPGEGGRTSVQLAWSAGG